MSENYVFYAYHYEKAPKGQIFGEDGQAPSFEELAQSGWCDTQAKFGKHDTHAFDNDPDGTKVLYIPGPPESDQASSDNSQSDSVYGLSNAGSVMATRGLLPKSSPVNVFLSHHNSDAAALAIVRERLEMFGFRGFLAHDDIRSGEPYVPAIENALRESDVFLYVGSDDANASAFCQQEIGMAKGLKKNIITSMMKGGPSPEAFVQHLQAIRYRAIDTGFADRILEEIWKSWEPDEQLQRCYTALRIRGFSTRQKAPDLITLQPQIFNDRGFQTLFHLFYRGKECGWVRIGYLGQKPSTGQNPQGIATSEKLPEFFPYLDFPFFSRVSLEDEYSSLKEVMGFLLNDNELMPQETLQKLAYEDVFNPSIRWGLPEIK